MAENTDWDNVLNSCRITLSPDCEIEKVQSEPVEENPLCYGSVEMDENQEIIH